jgi:hypothetical protein
VRRKREHEKKMAAQALRRKQAERARLAEAAKNPRIGRPRTESALRRPSQRSSRPSEKTSIPSANGLRPPENRPGPSPNGLRASEKGIRVSERGGKSVEGRVGASKVGAGGIGAVGGTSRVSVKSPPLRGNRPARWPDGRRSVRTQVPVVTHSELAEDGPFSDGNRGGSRHVISKGVTLGDDVSWDVTKVVGTQEVRRPGTAPSRVAGSFVRTSASVRNAKPDVRGKLLSPWSVRSAEEGLIFDGANEELPPGRSGRALSATKMLRSDGPAVMTWQRPESELRAPREGGWIGEDMETKDQQKDGLDVRKRPSNGQDETQRKKRIQAVKRKVKPSKEQLNPLGRLASVLKESSFASDGDTESLTPDSVVDAASEPNRLRRRLARKRRAAKWPKGEGWERDVLAKAATERRLAVLKEMAARIAERLEALASARGQDSAAKLAPEIEAIVSQAKKLLRGAAVTGRSVVDDPPEKVEAPKRRRKGREVRKRAASESQGLRILRKPSGAQNSTGDPDKRADAWSSSEEGSETAGVLEGSAERGPAARRAGGAQARGSDVSVTSAAALASDLLDHVSLLSPLSNSGSEEPLGEVNGDGLNVQSLEARSEVEYSHSDGPAPQVEQSSAAEESPRPHADEGMTSDVSGGNDVIADLDAEIRELLGRRRFAPDETQGAATDGIDFHVALTDKAGHGEIQREEFVERNWRAIVEGSDSQDDASSKGGGLLEGEERSGEWESQDRPKANVFGSLPDTLFDPDLYGDSDEEEEPRSLEPEKTDGLKIRGSAGKRERNRPAGEVAGPSGTLQIELKSAGEGAGESMELEQKRRDVRACQVVGSLPKYGVERAGDPKSVVTVKQLIAASEGQLLEQSVPPKVPAFSVPVPVEMKGDRLSIVHLYEKQLKERMERQQRQLEELDRKRKEDERKRNEEEELRLAEERKEAERKERAEREEEERRVLEEERISKEREEERNKEERKRNEDGRKRREEEREREEEERIDEERQRKEADQKGKESVGQPVAKDATGSEKPLTEELDLGAANIEAEPCTTGTERHVNESVGHSAKSAQKKLLEPGTDLKAPAKGTRDGLSSKPLDGPKASQRKKLVKGKRQPTLEADDVADEERVASRGVPNFFPQAKGAEFGRKGLPTRPTFVEKTGRRLTPQMLEQMYVFFRLHLKSSLAGFRIMFLWVATSHFGLSEVPFP